MFSFLHILANFSVAGCVQAFLHAVFCLSATAGQIERVKAESVCLLLFLSVRMLRPHGTVSVAWHDYHRLSETS